MEKVTQILHETKGMITAKIPDEVFTVWHTNSCMRSWNHSWIQDPAKYKYAAKFTNLEDAIQFAKEELNTIARTPIKARIFKGQLLCAKVWGENIEILEQPVFQLM